MRPIVMEAVVAPYFQPIVSLQTTQVIGFEVLGRMLKDGKEESLGPFFQNPDVSDDTRLELDRLLRERAIRSIPQLDADQRLFINLKPSWIYSEYKASGKLTTLEMLRRHEVDPQRVVIEVTEEAFSGDLCELVDIVKLYKEAGCAIAVDDVGSGFSSFERIALIQPDILKIDLNLLKKSAHHAGFQALLRSFSILSSQMGASLFAEGVETREDLYNAMQMGARYLQGYLFSKAKPEFPSKNTYSAMLREALSRFSSEKFGKFQQLMALEEQFDHLFSRDLTLEDPERADWLIENVIKMVDDNCIRMYICQEDGVQVSSNYSRAAGQRWRRERNYRGSNWAWRPYFVSNIVIMKKRGKGILSSEYTDLDSPCLIQTYSFPLGNGFYFFMDLMV
jgi:FOG: EAL domain